MAGEVHVEIVMDESFRDYVRGLRPEVLHGCVERGMRRALPEIHAIISRERLSGKGPFPVEDHRLGVVSGHGRRSFYYTVPETSGAQVGGALGTPVHYMVAHEFGFSGAVTVRAHTRTVKRSGKAYGGSLTPEKIVEEIDVREHQREVFIRERAPIRTGLEENANRVEDAILDQVDAVMQS